MTVGSRIRKIRRTQSRTLQEIADACDRSRSLLSKIETGKITPSLAALRSIANVLGVEISALIDDEDEARTVHIPKKKIRQEQMVRADASLSFFGFASERVNKLIHPYLFVATKSENKSAPIRHRGEEFVYILKGKMRFQVGDIEYLLKPGDSLYFDADEPHTREPISERAEYLLVLAEHPGG